MWSVRSTTGALWLLASALAGYWGVTLWVSRSGPGAAAASMPVAASQSSKAALPATDLARLLGAQGTTKASDAPVVPLASRFRLVGVLATPALQAQGVALIAIEAGPVKAYKVGAALDGGFRLQQVEARRVALKGDGTGDGLVWLELPMPTKAVAALVPPPGVSTSVIPPREAAAGTPGPSPGQAVKPQ